MGFLFIVLSVVLTIYFVPWSIIVSKLEPIQDTVQEQIDSYVDKNRFEGIIVYIESDGEKVLYSSGYNDRDEQTPANPESLFRIASISKLYMSVAATKLIDDGVLSLDDTLSELLPEDSVGIPNADEITLRMMIQHRSGLFNFIDSKTFPWEERTITSEDVLDILKVEDPVFEPNSRYKYSNSNFALLGLIMDKYLGYHHYQYIATEILEPLELSDTYYYASEIDMNELMSAYTEGVDENIKDWNHLVPGGNMISTAEDVGVFARALRDGSILTDSEQMIYEEIYPYDHTGLVYGYQSIVRYDEKTDSIIVILVNTTGRYQWSYFETLYNRIDRIINND